MQSLTEFLTGLGVWNWFILACALLMLEFVVPGVHFLWFGLAAAIAGIMMMTVMAIAPEFAATITWPIQLIVFALISTAIVFLVRKYALGGPGSLSDEPTLNARSAQYVGRTVAVEVAIKGGRGKVRIGDTLWLAKGADAQSGSRVKVTGYEGSVLVVEPVST